MANVDPAGENFIIFTSGSTGRPKGALLTQKGILAMIRPWAKNIGLSPDDRMLIFLPLNHVGGGTISALTALGCGAHIVLQETFHPREALLAADRYRITVLGAVPTAYALFFALPDFDTLPKPPFRLLIYGGAPAPRELLERMRREFGCTIVGAYGATEVSGFCTYTSQEDPFEKVLNTVGRAPTGVEIRIVDRERRPLPVGDIGEVAVRGELLFKGYLGEEEGSETALDKDGWFYTGDLGKLDQEGYLTLVGRLKEMYITAGFNVYPAEIEDLLGRHPAVATAAVIGVPDPIKGEVGWAFVIPKPAQEVSEEALLAFCRERLADYKVPARIILTSNLPMTPLGKIHKVTLKENLSQYV
jgi:fatty-acyl-CoA synthase